jgi:hypothetical protein
MLAQAHPRAQSCGDAERNARLAIPSLASSNDALCRRRGADWLSPSADEAVEVPVDKGAERKRGQRERASRIRASNKEAVQFKLQYEAVLLPGFQNIISELQASVAEFTADKNTQVIRNVHILTFTDLLCAGSG